MLKKLDMILRCWRYRFKSEVPSIRYILQSKELLGANLLDVGANKGIYSIYMSKAAGDKGKVIAFEAQPELGLQLDTVKKDFNLHNLQIENVALSSQPGTLTMQRKKIGAGDASFNFHDNSNDMENLELPVTTLDKHLDKNSIDNLKLIKCDVEGHELDVFRGGEELLKKFKPVLLFECHKSEADDGEIFRYLTSLGYDGFFFHVSQKDHAHFWSRGKGEYIHYSKYAEYEYCRPSVFHRNYIFLPKGKVPKQ